MDKRWILSPFAMVRRRVFAHRSARPLSGALALVAILSCALATPSVYAASASCKDDYIPPEKRDDAMALTLKGVACFEATSYTRALVFYRRAYVISSEHLLEAAIGRSLHELGLWGAALTYYQLYLKKAEAGSEGKEKIEERLAELERQLDNEAATLTVTSSPSGARVLLRAPSGHVEDLGHTPISTRVAPGKYSIELEQIGYYPAKKIALLSEKEVDELDVELVPQGATFNIESRRIRRIGTTTMLVSAPIATAGGVITLAAEPEKRPIGYGMILVGSIGLIAGGITTTLGYKREQGPSISPQPTKSPDALKRPTLMPLLGPTSAGVLLRF